MPLINWKEFSRRPHIQRLSLQEQKRQFVFENQMQQQRDMHLYYMINGPAGGYNAPKPNATFNNTRSLLFDGNNDFVTMGNVLNTANDGSDAFSFSLWFKTTNSNAGMLLSKQKLPNDFNGYSLRITNTNSILFFLGENANFFQVTSNKESDISNGQWHHLVLTYDGSRAGSGVTMYFDTAVLAAASVFAQGAVSGVSNTVDFLLGKGQMTISPSFFDGNIDEVAVFNSELSSSDVTSIYNSGVPNDISSLSPLSWWRMGDGDTASTLTDNGSGGNNGTINGATIVEDVPE